MHKSLATPINAILNPAPRRQIFEDIGINPKSPSALLDEAAIKPTSEPYKPSGFITVDEAWACAHPEAKHSVHLGPTGPVRVVEAGGETFYLSNDAAVLEPKAVCSNTIEPSAAPEAESTAAALGPELPCAAASPAVIKSNSYAATVSKPPVGPKFSAAASQPAAGPKLSAAASKLSADLKRPSAASKPAAAVHAPLEVNM